MNNKPTDKDQGFQAGVPGSENEQDERRAQPDRIDPSIDFDIDENDEGSSSRQAGSDRQGGVEKGAPDQQRRK